MYGKMPKKGEKARNSGFTLIELIIALSILGFAISVYVSLYTSSLEIGDSAQNRAIAIELANTKLQEISIHPEKFYWDIPENPINIRIPVKDPSDTKRSVSKYDIPKAMPINKQAHTLQQNLYEKFTWSAFASIPSEDSSYANITVVTHWTDASKKRSLAISSAIPRSKVAGIAP